VQFIAPFFIVAIIGAINCTLQGDPPKPKPPEKEAYELITAKEIASVTYDDATSDNGFICPLAKDLTHIEGDQKKRLDELNDKMDSWEPGQEKKIGQQVRNWIALCTLQDLGHGEFEAEVPYLIFERLKKDIPKEKLTKAVAWIILKPDDGKVILKAADLGFEDDLDEAAVRERSAMYAKKLLGRLEGKLPVKDE
jgi:hypothetical protein